MNNLPVPRKKTVYNVNKPLKLNIHQPVLTVLIIILFILNLFLLIKINHIQNSTEKELAQIHYELTTLREETSKEISKNVWELEDIINKQASLISDFNYHIQPQADGKIKLMLSAKLKSLGQNQTTSFTVTADNGAQQRIRTTLSDNILTSQVVLPLCESLTVGLIVSDQYSAKTETITNLTNIPQGLTAHLSITPSISMEQSGNEVSARVSGEVFLINEKAAEETRKLNTYWVDIMYNGNILHSIPFQNVSVASTPDTQQLYSAKIMPYPVPIDTAGTLSLIAHATDMEGFEYSCIFEQYSISAGGEFHTVSTAENRYFTLDN
ncbi:MAG: hypothetical protein RR205_01835 [Oscillospiraceae bacterium]